MTASRPQSVNLRTNISVHIAHTSRPSRIKKTRCRSIGSTTQTGTSSSLPRGGKRTNRPSQFSGIVVSFRLNPSSPDRSGHAAPIETQPFGTFARAMYCGCGRSRRGAERLHVRRCSFAFSLSPVLKCGCTAMNPSRRYIHTSVFGVPYRVALSCCRTEPAERSPPFGFDR